MLAESFMTCVSPDSYPGFSPLAGIMLAESEKGRRELDFYESFSPLAGIMLAESAIGAIAIAGYAKVSVPLRGLC